MADEAKARRVVAEDPILESLATIEGAGEVRVVNEIGRDGADAARLRAALDTMDEKITLLLSRHALLTERYMAAVAAQREVEEQLERMTSGDVDPAALEERVRELETRNDRLTRHAEFLEGRVEGLLARVRYVLE